MLLLIFPFATNLCQESDIVLAIHRFTVGTWCETPEINSKERKSSDLGSKYHSTKQGKIQTYKFYSFVRQFF